MLQLKKMATDADGLIVKSSLCNCQQADDNKLIDCILEIKFDTDENISNMGTIAKFFVENKDENPYVLEDEKTGTIIATYQNFIFDRVQASFDQEPVVVAILRKQFEI